MNKYQQIIDWLETDEQRMQALQQAAELGLPDWCIAAGFVRNLIWDKLHGYAAFLAVNDIDLIYFDSENVAPRNDVEVEQRLRANSTLPWSVKNQARMHSRNNDRPYASTLDAMSYWVEVETCIGARLDADSRVRLLAPFGVDALFANTITINPKRLKRADFRQRIQQKQWLENWPELIVVENPGPFILTRQSSN